MSEKEQQFERIYEKTKDFGRTQFVREIQMQINDNKKKDEIIKQLKKQKDDVVEYIKSYNLPEDLGHFGEAPISIRELREILRMLGETDD